MKIPTPLLATLLAFIPFTLTADNKHTPAPVFEPTLPWLTDLDQALQESRQSGKPILAEFR